jgi:sugar phosphate isomerase/epimerase
VSELTGAIDDFGMAAVSLAGSLPAKLAAMRAGGVSQVMLDARDIVGHPEGMDAAVAAVRGSGLRVTAFQLLGDFEGLEGRLHAYKIDVAKSLLELCAAVGSRVLVVGSSTSPHAGSDRGAIARDLRKLAMLAVPLGVRIAYTALSWGRTVSEFPAAWDVVAEADAPNLGLCLDSFHVFASGTPLEEIELLDARKIFLVHLADFLWTEVRTAEERIATGRHFRVFPGEGVHGEQLAELVRRLDALGYRGDYSFDVFNDDYRQMPPAAVVRRALRAAQWLGEDVLRRSVPLAGRMRLRRP